MNKQKQLEQPEESNLSRQFKQELPPFDSY